MTTALQVVQIIFQSVAIIFMICFMFIGIWSFIAFLKMAKNQRIQTFLLEKITNKPWLLKSGYLVGTLLGNKQNESTSRKTTNSILLLIIKCKLSGQN